MSRHFHHRRQHEHHHRGHDVRDSADIDPLTDQILSAIQNDVSAVATIVSVVYKTASQTFAGSIGGYVTMTASPPSQTSEAQAPAPSAAQTSQLLPPGPETQQSYSTTTQSEPASTLSAIATSETPSASSPAPVMTTLATSHSTTANILDSSTLLHSMPTNPVLSTDAAPSSTSVAAAAQSSTKSSSSDVGGVATEKSSGGLSGGAKAGIAIGVLLAVGLILGLLFFYYRRRRDQEKRVEDPVENEKNPFGDNAAIPTATAPAPAPASIPQAVPSRVSTPPQLSLRPASQFQPELLGRGGKAADVLGITGATVVAATAAQHSNQPTNPFEDMAAVNQSMASAPPAEPLSSNLSKANVDELPAPLRIRTPSPESEAGVVGGAAIAQRHNAPKPLDIKRTASPTPSRPMAPLDAAVPSPAATEFSMTSVSATSITSGPGAMNVHRIQLDFKPSMDDELELRAGQLVRLLHEYDDGWVSFEQRL